ncbi:hypothetical protein RF11_06091 [Thelohanellus kitauei]|uniref:Uncharacterized protein n=1 Tax=Thelohanellus kitauei TaxID=669202 RepID=A0A0C2ML73_THEKT|nr:hypothetical protein RF11_06091 [Thelohanellus kitauei]
MRCCSLRQSLPESHSRYEPVCAPLTWVVQDSHMLNIHPYSSVHFTTVPQAALVRWEEISCLLLGASASGGPNVLAVYDKVESCRHTISFFAGSTGETLQLSRKLILFIPDIYT